MLNAFLEKKLAHPITEVAIQNPYIQGQTKACRDAILDIKCQDSMGNRFIVEMQTGRQKYFFKRAVYYSSTVISNSGNKGEATLISLKASQSSCLEHCLIGFS